MIFCEDCCFPENLLQPFVAFDLTHVQKLIYAGSCSVEFPPAGVAVRGCQCYNCMSNPHQTWSGGRGVVSVLEEEKKEQKKVRSRGDRKKSRKKATGKLFLPTCAFFDKDNI